MCFPLTVMKVTGRSMEPALHQGDYVLVNRVAYTFFLPKKGDIVVFRHPATQQLLIKRIARIAKSSYSVKGDNVSQSIDSRTFGDISRKQIVGRVWKTIKKK